MLKYFYDASGNLVSQAEVNIFRPEITGQPVMQIVEPGQSASFSVRVANTSGVSFQWKFNDIDISGATGDSLLLTNVDAANVGQYSVVVTNSAGSVNSAPAALMLDSDHDGLPDSWVLEKFGSLTVQHSLGDPDHDGVSNLDEFLDDTNPNNSISLKPSLIACSDAGGSVTITPMKIKYDLGESITLTATRFAPNVFVGWSRELNIGDLISTTNPVTFAINGNRTVRARFATTLPIPPGLVAWWRAENNAHDVTGLNDGTPGDSISYGVGKVGRAFIFDGTGAVKVLSSKTLDVGTGNGFTIEMWIKPTDTIKPYPLLEWNNGSSFGLHLWIGAHFGGLSGPGSLFVNIVDTNNANHVFSSQAGSVIANYWQHIALTYERTSGVSRLFLNGIQVASANLGVFTPLTTYDLYLGHRPIGFFYSGLMDEPAIYNRALTINEIFSIYNTDLVGKDFSHLYFTSNSHLPDVVLGAFYTQQLTAILGKAPIRFSLSTGSLPIGMTLSSNGVVRGFPSLPGTFGFTVLATDAVGLSSEEMCVIQVLQSSLILIDAAVNIIEGSDETYFFIWNHYVIYNWKFNRVVDGVRPISELGFTPSSLSLGDRVAIDAAIKGRGPFASKAYFFKKDQYMRYNLVTRKMETGTPTSLSAFHFPFPFSEGVNSSFNGRLSREGKAYFFRNSQYVLYDWNLDRVDPGYPQQINTMIGMPPEYASGIDAAVDGVGSFERFGYLFKGDSYLRFDWNPSGGEPNVNGSIELIKDDWPGLAELLLAGKAKEIGLDWIKAAKAQLAIFANALQTGLPFPGQILMDESISTHFHIDRATDNTFKLTLVNQIIDTYSRIITTLDRSSTLFRYRTDTEAIADGHPEIPPSYAVFNDAINFTSNFVNQGTLSRTAMVLHESVHVFNNQSGTKNADISEWYVTDATALALLLPLAPDDSKFATRYDLMTTTDSLNNPSSFSAFAQHIYFGIDTRYGSGHPNL